MVKLILSSIMLITTLSGAVTGNDVVPIQWSQFTPVLPADSVLLKTKNIVNNEAKYFLNQYMPFCTTNDSGLYVYPAGLCQQPKTRPAGNGAFILSALLATGSYDSTITGYSEAQVRLLLNKLIKSIAIRNPANGGSWYDPDGYNPNQWGDALFATTTGFAAWLTWNTLDTATQTLVARMVEFEANRFFYDPPYCNDCTDDTKAEENAWNAEIITLAVAMLPNHANVSRWKTSASKWLLSAYARESDLKRNTLVDGKLPREWITGWNMREQGYLYNHGILHPVYMACIDASLYCLLFQSFARQTVRQAGVYNFDVVYKCFVDYAFPAPPFNNPGGTIYKPGKANLYYPQGTDWSSARLDQSIEIDAFADLLPNVGNAVSIPASEWLKIRVDTIAWRQTRFTTGQQYAPGEWDCGGESPWKHAEIMAGELFTFSYLAQWLKAKKAVMPVGNWMLSNIDSIAPTTPSSVSAIVKDPFTIALHWARSADIGSGVAYYRVLRNGSEVAFIKDTFFTDNHLLPNHSYNYRVSAVDFSNNESDSSPETAAKTFQDTISPDILGAKALDSSTILVVFNKIMDSISMTTTSNYKLDHGTIISAARGYTSNQVLLKVPPLTIGTCYTVTASGIIDLNTPPLSVSAGTSAQFCYAALENGLIGYWPMDELNDDTLYDASGFKQNLQLTGSFSHVSDLSCRALQLDSNGNGYATFKKPLLAPALSFPYSLSVWVKVNSFRQHQSIIATEDYSGQYYGTWMDIQPTGEIGVHFGNGGSPASYSRRTFISTGKIKSGEWNNVTAVISGPTDMAVYINGVKSGGTYSGEGTTMAHSSSGVFRLGNRVSAGSSILKFTGILDEVRIYKRALTISEISMLSGVSGNTTILPGDSHALYSTTLSCAPNPFNLSCIFSVSLPATVKTSLKVYNSCGQLVATLMNGVSAKGMHVYNWKADKLIATGIYTARLEAYGKILNKKVILIR
ncbi:MAG: hypothetical protein JNL74_06705 [Fibrobacteres bacterium]|nr:hypothetical protein [Fibrobacterota bacterium]